MPEDLLTVEHLYVTRGEILILKDISLTVRKGEVVAVIGPNGAGKSTLFGSIVGVHHIQKGSVHLDGRYIHRMSQEDIMKYIALVPQENAVFPYLTVLENLWVSIKYPKKDLLSHKVFDMFEPLKPLTNQEAATLSGGQRQLLAIAIGLIRERKLLILDEPSLGLAPILVKSILNKVREISEHFGLSILISEQTPQVLDISDRVYVLEGGQIRIEGKSQDLKNDERIRKVYLGVSV